MGVRIIQGDCRDVLAGLPAESVHCVCTSPPYWGLRSYLPDDSPLKQFEIGLEPTYLEYVEKIVDVFRAVHRVLRPEGVAFINLGDCYATGAGKVGNCPGGGEQGERWRGGPPSDKSTLRGNGHVGGGPKMKELAYVPGHRGMRAAENSGKHGPCIAAMGPVTQPNRMPQLGLKPKDLVGIPWRVAFRLQDEGWWLRSAIVWAKPNGMPGSQEDRTTSSYEMVFMLSKSAIYWSDFDAIKTPPRESTLVRLAQDIQNQAGSHRGNGGAKTNGTMKAVAGADKQRGHSRRHAGFNDRWDRMEKSQQQSRPVMMRDVWFIPPGGYDGPHFAVMPEEVARRCVLAGCPEGGTVLDPFFGAGTTGLVADRLGRNCIGIELNSSAMAARRIEGDFPLFAKVAAE